MYMYVVLYAFHSLTAKLDIQILHGKYYLYNKSWYHTTENNAKSSGWVLQSTIMFHLRDSKATSFILGMENVQQSLEAAT